MRSIPNSPSVWMSPLRHESTFSHWVFDVCEVEEVESEVGLILKFSLELIVVACAQTDGEVSAATQRMSQTGISSLVLRIRNLLYRPPL